MELRLEKEAALLEAIFFLEAEPLDNNALSKISGLGPEIIEPVLEHLQEKYTSEDSGIELVQISGGWIVAPKAELWESLKERYGKKSDKKLSRSAMETLSIIAYSQPITKGEIEAIRGVSADNMIRLLIERSLVKEVGKKDIPGKPIQYGTTKEFLKFFRLNSIADLPKLDETESERFELAR
ncbi:MAG: SMC-Scp complex subunit ScpB [Spirochaetaceae bacterium]|nr:SMC-Scp complex subunit ScpB [Spirochaetaceae bacterium]MBR3814145.1 SMC-Scp complex subunit ScpB [Spirochaetaceae bacterium]MDD6485974.1 SMC-Scp complex subunit ScpB [Spirochaetales bacterium]